MPSDLIQDSLNVSEVIKTPKQLFEEVKTNPFLPAADRKLELKAGNL